MIPVFNEERRIEATLNLIEEHLSSRNGAFEIIIVDDGSADGTRDIAQRWIAQSRQHEHVRVIGDSVNRGKGYAVRQGMLAAQGDRILFTDADLSTPIEELEKLDSALDRGGDIAIGSRGLPNSELARRQPWYREGLGRLFNSFVRAAAVPGIMDTQCGFKLFRRDAARAIFQLATIDGFAFDVEALFIARRAGYRVEEVPIRWLHAEGSKVRMLRDGPAMLVDLAKLRWRALRGCYRVSRKRDSVH